MAALWIAAGSLLSQPAAAVDTIEQNYGANGAALILRSANAMLNNQVGAGQPAGAIAHRCLAAAQLVPILGKRALQVVQQSADELVAMAPDPVNGAGWTFRNEDKTEKACDGPGTLDAFRDGTCNPAGVRYTYQTSLALTCVARAYALTHMKAYLETAQAVVNASWPHGGTPPSCRDCFSYWYSYHPNDANRYVRNVNALMGMALSAVYDSTGERRLRQRLVQIANAEHREVAAGNFGYLGIDDPRFQANPAKESLRIDNHVPMVAQGLRTIGVTIGNSGAIEDAKSIMASWLDCPGGACARQTCKRWSGNMGSCMTTTSAAPCLFRKLDRKFADACQVFMDRAKSLSAAQLWMVLNDVR